MNIRCTETKLAQISRECGSCLSPVTIGQMLVDPRQTLVSIAAAMGTKPEYLQRAIDLPEPIVYAPMRTEDVAPVQPQ